MYDTLKKKGYHYAGWAEGVARGNSITGLSALNFLQGTALMGMGGDACRNLPSDKIDKIRVDMAIGYLKTLQTIANASGGTVNRDVEYIETEEFHKAAFEKNGLTLDNWTLKTPMDLITQTQGAEATERIWEHLRDTGGTGLDAIWDSTWLLNRVGKLTTATDPNVASRAQQWMDSVPGPANWQQIQRFINIITPPIRDFFEDASNKIRISRTIGSTVDTFLREALNWVPPRRDPLVLDLDGNGITTSGINPAAPILFDQDGDGIKNATGWIASGEAIVVRDLNGNGTIDSGRELFGDNTILTNGPKAGQTAANGFEALADLDSSHYLFAIANSANSANDAHIKLRA